MARFPHYRRNVAALGKLIARARLDEGYRKRLMENSAAELKAAGLPENVLALMSFKIIDAQDAKTVALPFRLNQRKLDKKDGAYLRSIGKSLSEFN